MADHQTIVDQIRAVIAATDQTKTPQLVELASEYAALCNEVNARLRKCIDYLRRGLRAEAIHLADEHPVLLDMIAVLDLGGQPEWGQICAMYELAPPPPLLLEAAQELNQAYAADQPLRVLLDRHRLLALESAPLIERIKVMRELATADPASAFWDEDIRTFEIACLKRVKVEASLAIKNKDRPAIASLLAELSFPGWRVQAPPEIRTALERTEAALSQRDVVHQARLLMRELDEAYGAMNTGAVTAIVQKINTMLTAGNAALPPDLASAFAQAEQWAKQQATLAAQQQRIDSALRDLSQAIAENAPVEELELLRDSVISANGAVPEDLDRSVQQALQRRDDQSRKRARRRSAAIAVAAIAILAAGGIGTRAWLRNSRGAQDFQVLSGHYDQGNLAAAQSDIKRFSVSEPYVLERDDIKNIVNRLAEDQRAEEIRRTKWQFAVKTAQEAIDAADKSALANDSAWESAISATDDASRLAQLPDETVKTTQLREQITADRDKIRTAAEDDSVRGFQRSLDELKSKADALAGAAVAGTLAADDETLLASLRQASLLVSGVPDSPRLSRIRADAQALLAKLKDLAAMLDQKKLQEDRRKTELAELENVRASTQTPAMLKQALDQFIQRCPASVYAPRFARAMAHDEDWAAVNDAAILLDAWRGVLTPDTAARALRLDAIAAYRRKHSASPWLPILMEYKAYLSASEKALDDNGPWRGKFRTELDAPLLKSLQIMREARTGKVYYLRPEDKVSKDAIGTVFRYVIRGGSPLRISATPTHGTFDGDPRPSPQSALCAEMGKTIDAIRPDWETVGYRLAKNIADAREVDPILRVILLERVLNYWEEALYGKDDVLLSVAGVLGKANVDDLAWMDPDDQEANSKRDAAGRLVASQFAELKQASDAILAKRDELQRQLRLHVAARGVLLNGSAGWSILTNDKLEPGQPAYAVTSRGWSQVAEFREGKFVVSSSAVDEGSDGTMVFFLAPMGAGGK